MSTGDGLATAGEETASSAYQWARPVTGLLAYWLTGLFYAG